MIMSQPQDLPISDDDDTSHVSTPILDHPPTSPARPSSHLLSGSTSSDSTNPTSVLSTNTHLRLPIPIPSANLSQTSFTFVNVNEDTNGVDFDDLPPEVASADISIAREFSCSPLLDRCFVPSGRIRRRWPRGVPHCFGCLGVMNRSTSMYFIVPGLLLFAWDV